jgi:hemerythrin-like domain-containing protein
MKDYLESKETRRLFLIKSGILLTTASLLGACGSAGTEKESKSSEVSPTEDLMREHGVLRRIMLIYDEIGRRLKLGEEFPMQVLAEANDIIRRFAQDYHEKNEETQVFNRFSSAGKLVELVAVLYQQHLAGRRLIVEINAANTEDNLKNPAVRARVAGLLNTFNQLYRPHAAWEDTVLFPAFPSVISGKDLAAVGETFEKDEVKLFGPDGYARMVGQVADLEKKLGIYNLQQFTPKT